MEQIKAGDNVYITKYALTDGITQEVVKKDVSENGLVWLVRWPFSYFKVNRDVFANQQDAIEAAEIMRDKKITSMQKRIAMLKKLDFAAAHNKGE